MSSLSGARALRAAAAAATAIGLTSAAHAAHITAAGATVDGGAGWGGMINLFTGSDHDRMWAGLSYDLLLSVDDAHLDFVARASGLAWSAFADPVSLRAPHHRPALDDGLIDPREPRPASGDSARPENPSAVPSPGSLALLSLGVMMTMRRARRPQPAAA
jgi:hypothetical protein